MHQLGIVAIGRNEGDRLKQCLESALGWGTVVYVDSGSTDGSIELARSLGVEVVELDLSIPFTAARARNAGFVRLQAIAPQIEFVQFVDGDCEVVASWWEKGLSTLETQPLVGVVCGRRRERYPQASIYNLLCDCEWNTPVGEATACGGDAMMRVEAFEAAGRFNPSIIAGEEPELCVRVRQQGWKIWRLDAEMTLHDAAMLRFGQWWKRSLRAGHAYAEGAWRHGGKPERFWVRESLSIWFWGAAIPIIALGAAWGTGSRSLVLLLVYPLLVAKIYRSEQQRLQPKQAFLYALFCVIGKFANLLGQLKFHFNRLSGRQNQLIEYKG